MLATIPPMIAPLLKDYLAQFHAQLPELLKGFYLHGSIVLNAFDPQWSDIDFLAILKHPLTAIELKTLNSIHQELIITYNMAMDGFYLLAEDIGKETTPPRPHFNDGELNQQPFENQDVTLWLLQTKGINVYGGNLEIAVDWARLIAKMHENMNSYWKSFSTNPSRIGWTLSEYGIQWVITGTLRQYYTFCENDITSKLGAGEYGLRQFPQYGKIIQEALNIRRKLKGSLYPSPVHRALDAERFLKFIVEACNQKR